MKRAEWLSIALIVGVGLFLRLYRLDAVPPGMTHDEADVGYHAAAVYATGQPHLVDAPYGYINQPFVQYSGALFMRLLGPSDVAQRLHSVFFGAALIVATWLWARAAFDRWIALGAAGLMAVGFWPVMTSRFALNNQPVPALFTIGVVLLWRALFPTERITSPARRMAWAAASGFFFGLAVYPYEAGRAALLAVPAFGAFLLLLERIPLSQPLGERSGKGAWRAPFLVALAIALIVAAPHLLDPRSWGRTGTLVSETVGAGGLASLVNTVLEGLATLFVKGDPFVTYNIPDRPVFDPILAVLFVVGLAVATRRWRETAYGFTLIWLAFAMIPTLIVGAFTSTIHSIAAQTPVFVLLAIGLAALARFVGRRSRTLAFGVIAGSLIYSAAVTASDYFVRWAEAPAVRAAYYNYLASMLDAVNARSDVRDVALSSAFPDKPLDPFIVARRLRRDVALRDFDARRALVFPDSDSALLLNSELTPLDPALAGRLDLPAPVTIALRPDDLIRSFAVYNWNPRTISSQLISQLTSFSANLGDALELIGAQIAAPGAAPGSELAVISVWRVLDPAALGPVDPTLYDRTAVLFTHLVDAGGAIVAQDDRLDAPASSWRAGDVFAQVHRFVVEPEVPPGTYRVFAGAYVLPSQDRLRLPDGGDAVLVGEIEVTP